MGVPGRGVADREWVVLALPLPLVALAQSSAGVGLSVAVSCGSVLGEGALSMRRRCLIDMLREEAALSGRDGGDDGEGRSALLSLEL